MAQTSINGQTGNVTVPVESGKALRPVSVGAYVLPDATGRNTVGTSRVPFLIPSASTDLRLLYCNWYQHTTNFYDVDNTADLVLKAAIEDTSGTVCPVTFSGAASVTISPGGWRLSDPLPIDVPAGTVIYARTYTSGTNWFSNHYIQSNGGGGYGGFTTTTDLTGSGAAAIGDATAFTPVYTAHAILGTPLGANPPAPILTVGDSIDYGQADGIGNAPGYHTIYDKLGRGGIWGRALANYGGHINIGAPGDTAQDFVSTAGHFRRLSLPAYTKVMTCGYGTNELNRGRGLANVQADLIAAWTMGANRGMKVFQRTILPRTTSTDYWITTGNQTPYAWESQRVALNDWIRDGAPIIQGAAVSTGTNGAGTLRAGQKGHPLIGYVEFADAVETSRNSGLWKAPNSRTISALSMASGSFFLNNNTQADFTTADVGRLIVVPGIGAAGATVVATIARYLSATQVSLNVSATSTLASNSGLMGVVADAMTADGTHPQPTACALIGAAINTSIFTAAQGV